MATLSAGIAACSGRSQREGGAGTTLAMTLLQPRSVRECSCSENSASRRGAGRLRTRFQTMGPALGQSGIAESAGAARARPVQRNGKKSEGFMQQKPKYVLSSRGNC